MSVAGPKTGGMGINLCQEAGFALRGLWRGRGSPRVKLSSGCSSSVPGLSLGWELGLIRVLPLT